MKNISLQQLFYFKVVMKYSSFSKAAKLAYTTQSTISKNISALEKTIGEPLFIRQKNGVLPTQRAILLNLELAEFYDKIDNLLDTKILNNETLHIGFCQNIDFPSCMPNFFNLLNKDSYNSANIVLQCLENDLIVNKILDGSCDLGFILSDTNVSNPSIKLHNVLLSKPKLFFSKNSLLGKKKNIRLEDFEKYPIVTTKYLIEKNDYRMINSLPFTPKSIEIVDSYDDIPIYLATNKYITILRPYVTLSYDASIKSYELPESYQISQGITMIWKNNPTNSFLKKLINDITYNV